MTSIGLPSEILAAYFHGWKLGYYPCLSLGFLMTFLGMGVVYFLMSLSVQRCLILYYPTYFCIHGHKTACILIGFVWLMATIFATCPLLGFGVYLPEQSGLTCGPCFEHENCFAYGKFLLILGFLVPLIIMIISGCIIVSKLKEVKTKIQTIFHDKRAQIFYSIPRFK